MKKQNSKSAITGAVRSATGKKTSTRSTAAKTGVSGILLGTTGITVLSAAAIGVAGFFAWKNREKILSFVGNYVDLPESLLADEQHSTDAFEDVPSLRSNNYTQSSSEQRM